MDNKEQEQVQVLGFIGILIESIKIIWSHPMLYSKIALTFIYPFNFFVLAFFVIMELMAVEVVNNSSTSSNDFSLLSPKSFIYCCLKMICVIVIHVLYFFSTVAVIYTTGCIYAGKDITFKKVLNVAFQFRKRLGSIMVKHMIRIYLNSFVTTYWILLIDYGIIFGFSSTRSDVQFYKTWIIVVLLVSGEMYLILCMHLAHVITEIEDISGSKAKENTRQLKKGKYGTAITIAISLVLFFCSTPFFALAQQLVAVAINSSNIGLEMKILYGITSMVLNSLIITCCWAAPTMLYFVWKTNHGESINISSLDDCSDASTLNNGDYVALESSEGEKINKLEV